MPEPVDIIMLTYNRLDHLRATVDALEERTRHPYRLTIVDNASGADVRSWLAANRARFHRVILRTTNEHLPAFQHGIEATTSNPFILAEPDLIAPELDPCWLQRMLELLEAHPEFGIIGMGLEPRNRPSVLGPEIIADDARVGDDLVVGNLGMWFQLVRREALLVPYELDAQACEAVRSAGYRVGWTDRIRAYHLGWDDYRLHPGHLASKSPTKHKAYPHYREIELIGRPPRLTEIARAAPAVTALRNAGVPEESVVELSWSDPAVAAVLPRSVGLGPAPAGADPLAPGAAGAVVLIDPPAGEARALLTEAFAAATQLVVASAPLPTFGSSFAEDLAPEGWAGREAAGPSPVALAAATAADADPALAPELGFRTIEDRERWLAMFSAGAFGSGSPRMWIWERETPLAAPAVVQLSERQRARVWRPVPPEVDAAPRSTLVARARGYLQRRSLRRRVRHAKLATGGPPPV